MWRIILFLLVWSCTPKPADDGAAEPRLSVTVFSSEYGGYGYDIHSGNKLIVHQPTVPAMPGLQGFPDVKSAQHVGKLVIRKLDEGVLPPTLTAIEVMSVLKTNVPHDLQAVPSSSRGHSNQK